MNIIIMLSFLTIFTAILLGGHFLAYFSLVRLLDITQTSTKLWLGGIFFLLAISFVGANILSHYVENIGTRIFSFSSGVWLGMGVNLILALAVSWLVIGVAKLSDFQVDPKYLAVASIIFAVLFSGWGVWNAYHPRIKNITVKIENLPETWKGKTAVQISDVHLGSVLRRDFMAGIVAKINEENPEIVFITGDLFDGMDGILGDLVAPVKDIKAPHGTFFITGNHETYLGVSGVMQALKKTPVKVLDDEVVDVDGLQIVGVSYPQRGDNKNIEETIKSIKDFDRKKASILLYHNPAEVFEARASGVSLQLAGHTHTGQLFPFNFITRMIYGKYHKGLHSVDGFSIYTSVGTGTWGPTMRTNNIPEITVIHFE